MAQPAHASLPVAHAVGALSRALLLGCPGQVKHTGVHGVQFQDKWLGARGHAVAGSAATGLSTEAVEEFNILST